jgi:hypothetical protein
VETFLETADIAKRAGITPGLVRREAAEGKIKVAAVTLRGSRLFHPDDVREYLVARQRRPGVAALARRAAMKW